MIDTPKESAEQPKITLEQAYQVECAVIGEAYMNIRYERARIKGANTRRTAILQKNAENQRASQPSLAITPTVRTKEVTNDGEK